VTVAMETAHPGRLAHAAAPTQVDADGTALPPRTGPSPQDKAQVQDRDSHLLRLSLDLQLDALLLVLGASAAGRPEDAMPWRRWLTEDVELAWDLTTTALSVQGGVPPSLGSDLGTADPGQVTENLLARYTSMCSLLEDLLPADSVIDLRSRDDVSSAWQQQVRVALNRYRARVAELRAFRETNARTPDVSADDEPEPGAPSGHSPRRSYLPGELLG